MVFIRLVMRAIIIYNICRAWEWSIISGQKQTAKFPPPFVLIFTALPKKYMPYWTFYEIMSQSNFTTFLTLSIIFVKEKRTAVRPFSSSRYLSMAPATRLAVTRAFFRLLARRRIHLSRIIPRRLSPAVGTRHFIRVNLYQLFKSLSANRAFVL